MSIFSTDAVGDVLGTALDGLSARQTVIANNIANVDTPNFTASSVDFESSLREAIADGEGGFDAESVVLQGTETNTPAGLNGNNVDLRKEVMASQQNTFAYQILTRAVSDRLESLRTAARNF